MLLSSFSSSSPFLLLLLARYALSSPFPQNGNSNATADDPFAGEKTNQTAAEDQIKEDYAQQEEAAAFYRTFSGDEYYAVQSNSYTPQEASKIQDAIEYWETNTYADDIPYATRSDDYIDVAAPTDTGNFYYTEPKPTDPCGPKRQDPSENLFDTCTVDPDGTENVEGTSFVYHSKNPAPYGVQCLPFPAGSNTTDSFANAPTRTVQQLNTTACEAGYRPFCQSIQPPHNPPKDQWIWNEFGGPGCALGMWLSSDPNAAPIPDVTRCVYGIFRTMAMICEDGGPESQVAAVNVVKLQGGGATGQQVNAGYPSYIVAPETLTTLG
ncbi:MAG: hypothetical protein L6R40_006382 [Gallowayella cf. fulva]|nr:MAG: hypothetical protein L6R40_006382 [Xanthomendoza cf. fulva]